MLIAKIFGFKVLSQDLEPEFQYFEQRFHYLIILRNPSDWPPIMPVMQPSRL